MEGEKPQAVMKGFGRTLGTWCIRQLFVVFIALGSSGMNPSAQTQSCNSNP